MTAWAATITGAFTLAAFIVGYIAGTDAGRKW